MVLIVLYTLSSYGSENDNPELSKAIGLFLAANGLTASIRLFAIVFGDSQMGVLTDTDKLYLAVGAIAAFWVSFGTVIKTFAGIQAAEASVVQEGTEDEPTL